MRSIRARLLVLLVLLLGVSLALISLKSYGDAHHEVEEVFDAELAQTARLLAGLIGGDLSPASRAALQAALDEAAPFVPVMKACAEVAATLRIPLRNLLHYHGGVRVFRTRQLLLDVQAISRHRSASSSPPNEP